MSRHEMTEILHYEGVIQMAEYPEIIGLEKIVLCEIELPVFSNKKNLPKEIYLSEQYVKNGRDILIYNANSHLAGNLSAGHLNLLTEVDLILHSGEEIIVVEYKLRKPASKEIARRKKVKKQLENAQWGLLKNYNMHVDRLFYACGQNFCLEELKDNDWIPRN